MRAPRPPIERLLQRICVDAESGCWRWTGATDRGGYGHIHTGKVLGKTRMTRTHRVAYEFYVGPVPNGLQIDHVRSRGCLHRDCCNPDHLEAVTPQENSRRGRGPEVSGRRNAAKTHCPQGHPYSGGNVYYTPSRPGRICRECGRLAHAASRRIENIDKQGAKK